MHARVSFYDLGSGSKEDVVRAFENARVEEMPGNKGATLLVDTEHGKAITITYWEDEKALRDTEQQANSLRRQAAESARMTITSVEVYEVGVDVQS